MDPVKEKLNLLKKLASEKKSTNQGNGAEMLDISDKKQSSNRKSLAPRELSDKDMELSNKQVLAESLREADEVDDSFSLINFKKEEEDFPIEENSGSLIVIDDIDKIQSSESNMDIKMLCTNIETNANYRLGANTFYGVKSQQPTNKSFTVAGQHEPTSKYINRIRDMYDKERASSTECINNPKLKSSLPRQTLSVKKINETFSRDKLLSPQNSLQSDYLEKSEKSAPLASPEILRDLSVNDTDQEEPSIMSSNNGSVRHQTPSQRSQSYITHLRNTFNAHSIRSDSIEIAKRNSFVPESSHQIEKIKEKFFKINQPNKRSSYMHPDDMNKFASHYKSLRSLKDEELPSESTKVEQLVKNLDQEAKKNEPKGKKQVHRYQKSVTSDLSSFILERDKEIESRKAAQAREFEDMDKRLIDKYSKDARYAAENAIIKSSMSKGPAQELISSRLNDEETKRTENSAKLSNPIVSAIVPIMKRTKSILKSPSTFSEKTIQFDDKINIIPIDRTTDDNSPVPFDNLSQSYDNLNQFSSYSSFRPVVSKSNEIEYLKKNYENYDNYRWEYFKDLSPFRNHALAANGGSTRERIFVKSPTPMREIVTQQPSPPPSNVLPSSSFNRYLAISHNEDRNRFIKRTNSASFRSQSADLSKLVESSPKNIVSLDTNPLPKDRPVPQLMPSNARPNLTRQNALSKTFTKSLVEGMNKAHLSQKQEFKEHVSRSHRKKNRRKNYRRNKHSSSLSSSSQEINSSELSLTESTSSFSSSSYEHKFESRNRLQKPNNSDNRKKNQKYHNQSVNSRRHPGKKLTRHTFYSSDDSVCGIPKSSVKLNNKSKLCTSSKQFHKSMDDLSYDANAAESAHGKKKTGKNHLNERSNEKSVEKSKSSVLKDSSLSMLKNVEPVKQLASSRQSLEMKKEQHDANKSSNIAKTDNLANIGPVRKPLPSYSEVIQAKFNDMNKNRNSITFNYQQYSNQLINNHPNVNQPTNIVKNQNVPTPQSHVLQIQQQNEQSKMPNQFAPKSNQAINQAIFQQSRSKSLDPSLSIELTQNRSNEYQNFNDDHLIMPYQSAAIQERLKQFEQNTNIADKKASPPRQEFRQEIIIKRSPFESQNKENSPILQQPSNFNQLGFNKASMVKQRHTLYQPASFVSSRNEPELMFPVRSNLSTTKSVSNINLVKVPSMPNSKPLFNVNLTTATAAASEAIRQQQNDFTRIFQSCLERPELSKEKKDENSDNLKSVISVKQPVDLNNNVIKKTTDQKKNLERTNSKSCSPLASDSSKSSSRRNSPHKSSSKVAISLAPPTSEDVEMASTASSNKENNLDKEMSNEPSKLSISEKLKLFSGSNNPTSAHPGANITKKTNSVHNSSKINFKFQNSENEPNKHGSNLMSTKSFNYIDKVSLIKDNINKNSNSDDSSHSSKQVERLSAIKKKFESNSSQEIADDFEDFFKSKPVFKRGFRFKSLKFEPDLSVENKSMPNNYPKPSLIDLSSRKSKIINQLNHSHFDKPHQNIKRSHSISKNAMEKTIEKMEDNTDNQSSDNLISSKEPKLSFHKSKRDSPTYEENNTESKNTHESSPLNFGMTIQERMAALRKNGEEDWRKRSTSTSNEDKPISGSNLVKQQKEQLKQQLNQINIASRSNSSIKRNVLVPFLNEIKATQKHENLSDDNEECNIKKNRISQSNESLDIIVSHNQNILEKPPIKIQEKRPSPIKQSKPSRIHSAGSDTDSMLTRNTMAITKTNINKYKPEKVELFSTDSEMDSFFKDDILNKNLVSSNSSGNKTDDNTMNEEFDEEEFDQIVSDAKRLTQESRARPHRKTKSKGNHLKNLQNRMDIKNEYEQRHVPIVVDELTEEQKRQIQEQAALVNEITRMNRFNKN